MPNDGFSQDALALLAGDAGRLAARVSGNMCALAERYGKELTYADVVRLYGAREGVLREAGRVEVGAGALPYIAYALCDSEFIEPDGFADALEQFMELFYSFKNDCGGELTDEELIDALTGYFNACEGDMQRTADAGFADILRRGEE